MIKSLEKSSVHRITSGQVLVDLQTAVKELVENSMDAGATNIGQWPVRSECDTRAHVQSLVTRVTEVRFKDHGLDTIEVIDNGHGIAPADFDSVGECTLIRKRGPDTDHNQLSSTIRPSYLHSKI